MKSKELKNFVLLKIISCITIGIAAGLFLENYFDLSSNLWFPCLLILSIIINLISFGKYGNKYKELLKILK